MPAEPSTRGNTLRGDVPVTYDEVPPFRPTVDDMGGAKKKNVEPPRTPPNPVRSVTAEDWNQAVQQVEALARVAPIAILTVRWTGFTPVIEQAAGMGAAAKNPATYTVTSTAPFSADVNVSWPARTFPGRVCRHVARLASLVSGTMTGSITTEAFNNGVTVRQLDDTGGSPTSPYGDFVLFIYGQ
jgi:hypothetical protein